jgi:Flp pilus assembly protein TadG
MMRRPSDPRRRGTSRGLADATGSALLEFSLVLVLLLMLLFGLVDFGRALYTANTLNLAVREAARFAAVAPNPEANLAAIKDTAVARLSPFGGDPLTPDQVTVTYHYGAGTPATLQSTTVSVEYPFTMLTPIRPLLGLPPLTLHAAARYRWELGG